MFPASYKKIHDSEKLKFKQPSIEFQKFPDAILSSRNFQVLEKKRNFCQ